MIPRYAREEMKDALARVEDLAQSSIGSLRAYGESHVWAAAVDATLAIQQAPKHLLRAQLVLLGSLAGGGPIEGPAIERFATGVELLHLFMLVHDDVMDNATIRRGKPALRIALQKADPTLDWQTARDTAIVVGSTLSMLAVRLLMPGRGAGAGAIAACDTMIEACFHAGAGQFQDLLGFRRLAAGEGALRRALVGKTAYHSFAAPFAAGLLLASPASDIAPALAWGEHVGVAFQATDDLMDLLTPPSETGKDALRDLLLGRPSLPLHLLRERATGDDVSFLESVIGKHVIDIGERAALLDLMERTGVVTACAERIRVEIAEASAIGDAARFPAAAREGMSLFERSLLAYASATIEAARNAT